MKSSYSGASLIGEQEVLPVEYLYLKLLLEYVYMSMTLSGIDITVWSVEKSKVEVPLDGS